MQTVVRAIAITAAALCLVACGKRAEPTLEAKFGVALPKGARIEHFEWSGMGMDHWYIWVIEYTETAHVQTIADSAELEQVNDFYSPGGLWGTYPPWWDQAAIESLPKGYYRDEANMFWRMWVDPSAGRIYLQWFDT